VYKLPNITSHKIRVQITQHYIIQNTCTNYPTLHHTKCVYKLPNITSHKIRVHITQHYITQNTCTNLNTKFVLRRRSPWNRMLPEFTLQIPGNSSQNLAPPPPLPITICFLFLPSNSILRRSFFLFSAILSRPFFLFLYSHLSKILSSFRQHPALLNSPHHAINEYEDHKCALMVKFRVWVPTEGRWSLICCRSPVWVNQRGVSTASWFICDRNSFRYSAERNILAYTSGGPVWAI
jgi:hypothetical protein